MLSSGSVKLMYVSSIEFLWYIHRVSRHRKFHFSSFDFTLMSYFETIYVSEIQLEQVLNEREVAQLF